MGHGHRNNNDDRTKTKGDTEVNYTREDTGGAIKTGETHWGKGR